MNKIFRLLPLAVAAVCSLTFASCGDDDDDDNNTPTVITGTPTSVEEVSGNTWVLNLAKSSAYGEMNGIKGPMDIKTSQGGDILPNAFTFNSDGTADVLACDITSKGQYRIEGKEFSCSYTIVLNKTAWDENGTEESKVEKDFTLEKGADLTKVLYSELGGYEGPMNSTFTQCEISKAGNQLILNATLTTKIDGSDMDISGAYEFGDMFGNLINNTINSKKYVSYHLVYDKK